MDERAGSDVRERLARGAETITPAPAPPLAEVTRRGRTRRRLRVAGKSTVAVVLVGSFAWAGIGLSGLHRRQPATSGPSPSALSAAAMCASMPDLDRLVVRRTSFPENHIRFGFPAEVTVTDPSRVAAAARAVCALPKMPKSIFHCPMEYGVAYRLSFFAGEQMYGPVTVQATGCQTVRGLGAIRWVARSSGFWVAIGHAMGLAHPDERSFRGSPLGAPATTPSATGSG